ncbi:rhodanese-like domain-containing protein [Frigoribacterium sp. VKM Ac-1396]|uniref:rhodanese-like domain-containing protein n=1 Tax=Frigoribacterium sp. VKM Ac-1396 TaxID=2783821 RepID=UPI00188DA234|nr:rhodanese-like domain-containing protein [Frigoribacterium sp. VKM Ac-1396]
MRQITVDRLAAQTSPLVVDVSGADEFAEGHVPGALNLHPSRLADRFDEMPHGVAVHLISRDGSRSARATAALVAHGIDAVDVVGGTTAWIEAGLPLSRS